MADNQKIDSQIKILTNSFNDFQILNNRFTELDLGCGKGSFTSNLAQKYPDRNIIAVDVMIGRLRKLVKRNNRLNIKNIFPVRAEAKHFIFRCLPDKSIDRIHILCPDPWPKERHKEHRLISSEFIYRACLKLKDNGILHFATDDTQYCSSAISIINRIGLFSPCRDSIKDIKDIKTDFEIRWTELGCNVHHAAFKKITQDT
ncbi:MAG: methyltransferase domain-containing protein [Victivallales bacterium]|nr:methyltransferase domain-containing protein [Victivallales bacterium]MCF7888960.1 methyltransferase domain-containing protein [Victivallales bacterium]